MSSMITSIDAIPAKRVTANAAELQIDRSVNKPDLLSCFPGRRRLFFPVIHIINDFDALFTCEQVRIAVENGADGVFLIQGQAAVTGSSYVELPRVFSVVREMWPDLWIGLNFMAPDPLPYVPATCNALWVDKGIAFATTGSADHDYKVEVSPTLVALLTNRRTLNPDWHGLVFPGFFFKGSNRSFAPNATLEQKSALIRTASEELDALGPDVICCTSGPGTGNPLEHDRASLYREFVKGPIAVASGVTNENIVNILPHVDIFMVGTGIEELSADRAEIDFFKEAGLPPAVKLGHLNPLSVRAMSQTIHSYTGATSGAECDGEGMPHPIHSKHTNSVEFLQVNEIHSSGALLCKAECGFYGRDSTDGYCSACFKKISSVHNITSNTPGPGMWPRSSFETKFSKQFRVPTQFDAYKLPDGLGNQCSWIAHQFSQNASELIAALGEDNECGDAKFLAIYNTCMSTGSALRRAHCASGQSLPVGENVDDEAILRATAAGTAASDTAHTLSRFQIVAAAPGSIFHQQLPLIPVLFPELANRILKSVAEDRHGTNSTPADFRRELAALPACGACILERHIESMTIIRTHEVDVDSERAFLICDSHSTVSGLTDLTGAINFTLRLIPKGDFPLTFATSK